MRTVNGVSVSFRFNTLPTFLLYLHTLRTRHEADIDTIRLDLLMGIPAILALLFNYEFTIAEVLWSFSIFLEAVAILPQMFLLQRIGEAETITTHYIFALGAYRALYLLNWIYRYVCTAFVSANAEWNLTLFLSQAYFRGQSSL